MLKSMFCLNPPFSQIHSDPTVQGNHCDIYHIRMHTRRVVAAVCAHTGRCAARLVPACASKKEDPGSSLGRVTKGERSPNSELRK